MSCESKGSSGNGDGGRHRSLVIALAWCLGKGTKPEVLRSLRLSSSRSSDTGTLADWQARKVRDADASKEGLDSLG